MQRFNSIPCSLGVPNCAPAQHAGIARHDVDVQPPLPGAYPPVCLNKPGVRLASWEYTRVAPTPCGPIPGYVGSNPKLVDAMRAQRLTLDRPHTTGEMPVGNVSHDAIYTPEMAAYGKDYLNYGDINAGQIQYYLTETSAFPYIDPVYATPAEVAHVVRTDPMGVARPEYPRAPLTAYAWDPCVNTDDSFTHDTLTHREDLMALQSRRRNQQEYGYRYPHARRY